MKIIAFTAKKETGKTTAVKYMMQKYPNSIQINFKDALVEEIKHFFPEVLQAEIEALDKSHYDGMDPWTIDKLFKVKPPVIRALMRNFGTEVRRKQNPEYWVEQWQEKVNVYDGGDVVIFVDDVRFMNEADAIAKNGGMLIRIESDKQVPEDIHTSESEMYFITPDRTVRNFFGSVEVMYKQLDEITIK